MRAALIMFALAGPLMLASPAQAAPASIVGKWKTGDGKSIIAFEKCGSSLCGRIDKFLVAEPAGGARDTKNPNASLRDRKLLGMRIFWNLAAGKSKFEGKGYSPEDGREFNAQVWREGNMLKVKGCVLVFCRTASFTKA